MGSQALFPCLVRLKTGNVPPIDFVFEELMPGMEVKSNGEKRNSMSRARSKQALNAERGNINYFQRKRELQKKIEAQESDVLKGKQYSIMISSEEIILCFEKSG